MRIFLLILGYLFFILGICSILLSLSMAISELSFGKEDIFNLIIILFIEFLVVLTGIFLLGKLKEKIGTKNRDRHLIN